MGTDALLYCIRAKVRTVVEFKELFNIQYHFCSFFKTKNQSFDKEKKSISVNKKKDPIYQK